LLKSIKRLTKHSAIYGLGHILNRSIGFILTPIHTNYLDPDIIGTAALLFSSLAMLNVLFGYGMDVAFLRYFILEKSTEARKKLFSTAFYMILSTGIVFSILIFLNSELISKIIFETDAYPGLIKMAAGILLADALALIPFLALRGQQKPVQFGLLKFINVAVNLGLNVWLVIIQGRGIEGIFIANLVASCFTLITVLPLIFVWLKPNFNKEVMKSFLKFGLPYIPSMLSVIIMDQISRFFLNAMVGKEATGIFSASYKLGMFMALVVAAFRFAWHPFFLSTARQKDAKDIFARILTYYLVITGGFFLIISFFINEIVHLKILGLTFIGEKYLSGIPIVPMVMLAYIFLGVYVNFLVGVYLKKKTGWLPLITGIGALVSIVGNYLLIPILGIHGAAWATALAYGAMAFSLYIFSKKIYPVSYEWIRILKLIIVMVIQYYLGACLLVATPIIFRLGILLLIPVFLGMLKFYTPDELGKIKRILKHG